MQQVKCKGPICLFKTDDNTLVNFQYKKKKKKKFQQIV